LLGTYVVQPAAGVSVGNDLYCSVRSLGDVEVCGDWHSREAEIARTEFLDCGLKLNVEGRADFVADGEEDGNDVFSVAKLH
jgi:hypothetical protein